MRNFLLILPAIGAGSAAAADWPQFGYDEAHSGYNRAENGYSTTGNVPLFHYNLPNAADSAPVYLANVSTTAGTKDVLFIVTKNGTLLAVDAAATTAATAVLWSKRPTGSGTLTTGSPAIDPNKQYIYAYGLDGKVHKYQVGDGTEVTTTCAVNSYNCWPEQSTLKPNVEKGASGLATAVTGSGTFLYSVMDGYIGDGGDYQGHITTIDLGNGTQTVFNSECSALTIHFVENGSTGGAGQNDCASKQNGIWGRPGAIYDAGTNRVFIATGNGPYNPSNKDWGDSVLALNVNGIGGSGGNPVDSYTPSTFQNLQNTDADLGSNSLAIVPAPAGSTFTHLGVIAGKDDCVRLIRLDDMSGQGGPGHSGGSLQSQRLDSNVGATNCDDTSASGGADGGSGEIRAQPAVWVNPADASTWVYISNRGGALVAYKVTVSGGTPALTQQWTGTAGTSPLVANGTVYYLAGSNLVARDAVSGASIWQSAVGGIHWQSPILVNGRIYVIDNVSQLWTFELDGIFRNGFQ